MPGLQVALSVSVSLEATVIDRSFLSSLLQLPLVLVRRQQHFAQTGLHRHIATHHHHSAHFLGPLTTFTVRRSSFWSR